MNPRSLFNAIVGSGKITAEPIQGGEIVSFAVMPECMHKLDQPRDIKVVFADPDPSAPKSTFRTISKLEVSDD